MSADSVSLTHTDTEQHNRLVCKAIVSNGDKSEVVDALWDTGATSTCIDDALAQRLGLPELESIEITTPSGKSVQARYRANITLMNKVPIGRIRVTGTQIGLQKLGLLIGMDIISRGDFATSHKDGVTQFTFRIPSIELADYTC